MENSNGNNTKNTQQASEKVLSSEKREDLWAIIIAGIILILCCISPDAIYTFFKKSLFIF